MSAKGRRIEVSVLGNRYPVRVGTGPRDEERLRAAAQLINDRIAAIGNATGEVDAQHLAVMAALALADEVLESAERLRRDRADDEAFREVLRSRSERLLSLVEEELRTRLEAAT